MTRGRPLSVGDLITVRGVQWSVDEIDGDTVHVARGYPATTIYGTVALDEIDTCEHEGRLKAVIESLRGLRGEIDGLVGNGPEGWTLLREIDAMIKEAEGKS